MTHYLAFEKPLAAVEGKAEELRALLSGSANAELEREAEALDQKAQVILADLYRRLTPWQKCQIARHPERPRCKDYIKAIFTEYTALAGDRGFGDDNAVMGGLARLHDRPVVVIGHEKGNDTQSRIAHNFGMAHPEGYRKAIRLMQMADRFGLPIVSLVDTPGAHPGKSAEERGQAEAIARTIHTCLKIGVPFVAVVIGEGGSGGAMALATANRVAILEHAIYSVISPEGCASILWKNADKTGEAAQALRLTAQDLHKLGVIDRIVAEPLGGAHRNAEPVIEAVNRTLNEMLTEMNGMTAESLIEDRREKFLKMGLEGLSG